MASLSSSAYAATGEAAGLRRPRAATGLARVPHRRPPLPPTPVVVLAESTPLGAATVMMASNLGYPAGLFQSGLDEIDLDRGLMLIVGSAFAPDFQQLILSGPWVRRTDRTVVFGADMPGQVLAALNAAGFPFIVGAPPTVDRLAGILATMAPESVDGRRATIMRREAANTAIEAGADRLFAHIRGGDLSAAVSEARDAFDHFDALLDSAAASHWISLMQSYHDGTAQHCSLVSAIAMLFARSLGFSSGDQRRLFEAAHFHDVGKVEVPLAILDKPGALTAEERRVMETHAGAGYAILGINSAVSAEIAEAARDHHEYLDGSGYPHGIGAKAISDVTRIITISDIFAALIERRAYKQPRTAHDAYSIMLSMEGRLDMTLLKAFRGIAEGCAAG